LLGSNMLVNVKVTGGLNIESGQIDPKATQGLNNTKPYTRTSALQPTHTRTGYSRGRQTQSTQVWTGSGKMASSYCGQCRRCVRPSELFLPIQAKKRGRKKKSENKLTATMRLHDQNRPCSD